MCSWRRVLQRRPPCDVNSEEACCRVSCPEVVNQGEATTWSSSSFVEDKTSTSVFLQLPKLLIPPAVPESRGDGCEADLALRRREEH